MDILAITKPFSFRKRKAFSEKKNMTGSISDKEQREIGREVHRENSFLKVPTPVFVIPGVILFVVGMLLVILIWTPLNLWKSGTGLGANSISIMAGFLFALFLAGFVYAIHLIFDWVESGYKNLLVLDQDIAGLTLLVIGGGRENKMQNANIYVLPNPK